MLTNWQDHMLSFAAARNCPEKAPVRYPGINGYYSSKFGYKSSELSYDSFALSSSSMKTDDPSYISGSTVGGGWIDKSGTFTSVYDTYKSNPMPIEIQRKVTMPPKKEMYLIEYILTNKGGSDQSGTILDFLGSGDQSHTGNHPYSYNCAHGIFDSSSNALFLDQTGCASGVVAAGPLKATLLKENVCVGNGSKNTESNPLMVFNKNSGKLNGAVEFWGDRVGAGSTFDYDLCAGCSASFWFYRSEHETLAEAKSFAAQMMNTDPQALIDDNNASYQDWLSKAKKPNFNGNSDQEALYYNSLVTLKNAQNPTRGAIASSFHPLYGYKVWSRDSTFAALIFDSAGYHDEALFFLKWASGAVLRDDGFFHTCYDVFTGKYAPFVEPQIDGTGAFLLAVQYHASVTKDLEFLVEDNNIIFNRMRDFESFFMNSKGKYDLAIPDYSIWEESSTPDGKPLPTQYYTFSQIMSHTGLIASSIVETWLGNVQQSEKLQKRAEILQEAIQTHLWDSNNNYYYRGMWSDTLELDTKIDGSTAAAVFTGFSDSQSHLQRISDKLTHLNHGIARYEGDRFFYSSIYNPCGKEVGAVEPPWGVCTCFLALSEIELNINSDEVDSRIQWMVDTSAYNNNPVGECIDGVSGLFVSAAAPDIYEHGGVYILTQLVKNGLSYGLNPKKLPKPN
ncbi:trehalase [Anaeramoeba flamelloides]|uniref:Trehalase n=1 Tax=Anaeramoeba flamelloides TaxID=1746091 RepID=A0ABQ8X369_9EUKA|nr:trehalase [Anaeramoeba flamelloides]